MFKKILSRLSRKQVTDSLSIGSFQLDNLQSQMLRFDFYYVGGEKPAEDRFIRAQELSVSELKEKYLSIEPNEMPIVLAGKDRNKADRVLVKAGFKQVYIYED